MKKNNNLIDLINLALLTLKIFLNFLDFEEVRFT